jgi:hypothetical protein
MMYGFMREKAISSAQEAPRCAFVEVGGECLRLGFYASA